MEKSMEKRGKSPARRPFSGVILRIRNHKTAAMEKFFHPWKNQNQFFHRKTVDIEGLAGSMEEMDFFLNLRGQNKKIIK